MRQPDQNQIGATHALLKQIHYSERLTARPPPQDRLLERRVWHWAAVFDAGAFNFVRIPLIRGGAVGGLRQGEDVFLPVLDHQKAQGGHHRGQV